MVEQLVYTELVAGSIPAFSIRAMSRSRGRESRVERRRSRESQGKGEYAVGGRGKQRSHKYRLHPRKEHRREYRGIDEAAVAPEGEARRRLIGGKPREGKYAIRTGRKRARYGCGNYRGRVRLRTYSISERMRGHQRDTAMGGWREGKVKRHARRGENRKRLERTFKKTERERKTIRIARKRRGLPVRGQRTVTNGQTARKLNAEREHEK